MADLTENPLEMIAGAEGEDPEAILARDSNAVPSVFRPEWRKLGAMLSTRAPDAARPSPLCYALQATVAATAVFILLRLPHRLARQSSNQFFTFRT